MSALHALNVLAATIHGGALLTFALLIGFRARIPHVRTEDVVRVYRAFGAGIGLSLGVFVPTDLVRHILGQNPGVALPDALALHWDSPSATLWSARMVLLLVLWVSYVHLEVWTLDPCRTLDKDGRVTDATAYEAAAGRVAGQLALNAALFAAVITTGALAVTWP